MIDECFYSAPSVIPVDGGGEPPFGADCAFPLQEESTFLEAMKTSSAWRLDSDLCVPRNILSDMRNPQFLSMQCKTDFSMNMWRYILIPLVGHPEIMRCVMVSLCDGFFSVYIVSPNSCSQPNRSIITAAASLVGVNYDTFVKSVYDKFGVTDYTGDWPEPVGYPPTVTASEIVIALMRRCLETIRDRCERSAIVPGGRRAWST